MPLGYDEDGDLPEGVHEMRIEEFWARYGYNPHRRALLDRFEGALVQMKAARGRAVVVGGSFVTNRESPNDIDACCDDAQVDPKDLPEMAALEGQGLHLFLDLSGRHLIRDLLFRLRRGTTKRVGIVLLDLEKSDLPLRRRPWGSGT
ncbi:MAG: hypothetical protein FJX75_29035 [Armatimonadetes bacterium]|nr:hypothetical protein [Armatimonadota bacterium]